VEVRPEFWDKTYEVQNIEMKEQSFGQKSALVLQKTLQICETFKASFQPTITTAVQQQHCDYRIMICCR
jgi:hypothetical protein